MKTHTSILAAATTAALILALNVSCKDVSETKKHNNWFWTVTNGTEQTLKFIHPYSASLFLGGIIKTSTIDPGATITVCSGSKEADTEPLSLEYYFEKGALTSDEWQILSASDAVLRTWTYPAAESATKSDDPAPTERFFDPAAWTETVKPLNSQYAATAWIRDFEILPADLE